MSLTPNQNDVLFGKGRIAFNHEGNKQYRSLVELRKDEYLATTQTKKKQSIVFEILNQIESMDPPGRFLMTDSNDNTGGWVLVDRQKAIDKISHRLREKKKEIKEKTEKGCVDPAAESDNTVHSGTHLPFITPKCTDSNDCNSNFIRNSGESSIMESEHEKNLELKNASNSVLLPNVNNSNHILHSAAHSSTLRTATIENLTTHSIQCTSAATISERVNVRESKAGRSRGSDVRKNSANTMLLREWITHEIDSLISSLKNESMDSSADDIAALSGDEKISLALSSRRYINNALHIAHSLSDQICKGEDGLASFIHEMNTTFLPPSGYDWSSKIVVFLRSEMKPSESFDFEPLPLCAENDARLENIDIGVLLSSNNDDSLVPQSVGIDGEDSCKNYDSTECHDKYEARILPPGENEVGDVEERNSETQRIYHLGLVFYELFSGGKMPSCIEASDAKGNSRDGLGVDLSRRLNISDAFEPSNGKLKERKKGRIVKSNNHISTNLLRSLGVPSRLCDLIDNMLVCPNTNISEDETYSHMADVRSDLYLMINKPEKFLNGLDAEKMLTTGLKLNDESYFEQKELESLCDLYRSPCDCGHDYSIILGPSGIGKTVLAKQFEDYVISNGGVFLSGKFDQFHQATPFVAITSAFNDYCNFLISDIESKQSAAVADALREALGQDACYLAEVVPNLCMIFGGFKQIEGVQNCINAQKRLQYLLCRFVGVITISSPNPVVLFLDDLQWADPASISTINHLLLAFRRSRFLFVGSCRDDNMSREHPIRQMISSLSDLRVHGNLIKMSLYSKDAVNSMVSDMLCLSPRLTRPLSEIMYQKTKGSPLFLLRLMLSLSDEGLLQFNLSRRRWEWEEEKIHSRKIPEDVAEFLTNAIERLSPDVQDALCTLSCFGAYAHISVIEVIEREVNLSLQRSLELAVVDGYLDKIKGGYMFSHDRVQEAAYNMMGAQNRIMKHSQYGVALALHTIHNEHDVDLLFTAVDQINRGGPENLLNAEMRPLIAKLNLKAGKKAMDMSDFSSALSFFDHGIHFMGENHWSKYYDLSLQLFDNASKCSYAIGDHRKLGILSEQILSFSKSFEDKLNVIYHSISIFCDTSVLDKAIEKGLWVLSTLGENLTLSISREGTLALINETRAMLHNQPNNVILNYAPMTMTSKIAAMKFLARLLLSLIMARPDDVPIFVVEMVHLSLSHGLTPMSAIGIVYFGSILASIGNIEEGYRFVKLAKDLVDRFGSKDVAGEVILIATQTVGCVEPMQSTLEYHLDGHKIALEAGDTRNAILNLIFHCNYLFWTGAKLSHVKAKYENVCNFAEGHNLLSLVLNAKPLLRTIEILVDTTERSIVLDYGLLGVHTEDFINTNNPHAAMMSNFQLMYISFFTRNYHKMKEFAEIYFEYKLNTWILLQINVSQSFICGLASFWIHRQTRDNRWLMRGIQSKNLMKRLADSSQWNFLQKFYLLRAEELYCYQQYEEAEISYDRAISFASKHKFVNDEALASELAGYFANDVCEESGSSEYFTQAYKKYREWGASAKASMLFQYIDSTVQSRQSTNPDQYHHMDNETSIDAEKKRSYPTNLPFLL